VTRGVFPRFVKQVHRVWSAKWPGVDRVPEAFSPSMPKASTLYVGSRNRLSKHVFVNFQHNSKPWGVGEFTVNIVLSDRLGPPSRQVAFGEDLQRGSDGVYRLGSIVHGRDKWWCLLATDNLHGITWRATSYADQSQVFQEALADVTSDVEGFLKRIEHELPNKSVGDDERPNAMIVAARSSTGC